MWLFGGAFGVGGEKRGWLRYRHENVLKKTSRYKMFRILAIFGVCGILYMFRNGQDRSLRSRIKRAVNNKKTAAHKTLGQLPKL